MSRGNPRYGGEFHAQVATCFGKKAFENKRLAVEVVGRDYRGPRHAYRCKVCHLWHIASGKAKAQMPQTGRQRRAAQRDVSEDVDDGRIA